MAVVYAFTPRCRAVLQQIRAVYSRQETASLFRAIRQIVADPMLLGSGLSYHDPQHPEARFYRVPVHGSSPKFTIFYSVADDGTVIFADVWHLPP